MKDMNADPKQQAILEAAWQAFATYGFRKTSMDDIARGAGMSRPAVYLHYRNKEDIFRSLVQHYYDKACADVAEALAANGEPSDVLMAAFRGHLGPALEAMLTSPHGHELLDTGAQTANDIKQEGEARLRALYADWLSTQSKAGQIRLEGSAVAVADTICAALRGFKDTAPDYAVVVARFEALARLIGTGLVPR